MAQKTDKFPQYTSIKYQQKDKIIDPSHHIDRRKKEIYFSQHTDNTCSITPTFLVLKVIKEGAYSELYKGSVSEEIVESTVILGKNNTQFRSYAQEDYVLHAPSCMLFSLDLHVPLPLHVFLP